MLELRRLERGLKFMWGEENGIFITIMIDSQIELSQLATSPGFNIHVAVDLLHCSKSLDESSSQNNSKASNMMEFSMSTCNVILLLAIY